MSRETWSGRLMAQPPGYPEKIVLSGPRLVEFVQELLLDLAFSIHEGDIRAQAWTDYLIAIGNRRAAEEEGMADADAELLDDAIADAWHALEPELGVDLYLTVSDASQIAHLLANGARAAVERKVA